MIKLQCNGTDVMVDPASIERYYNTKEFTRIEFKSGKCEEFQPCADLLDRFYFGKQTDREPKKMPLSITGKAAQLILRPTTDQAVQKALKAFAASSGIDMDEAAAILIEQGLGYR